MKPHIAGFLSFLLNGLGQIYNGQSKKGIFFIIVSFIFLILFISSIVLIFEVFISSLDGFLDRILLRKAIILFSISGFILCLNGLYSILDAYMVAKINETTREK